MEEQKKVEAEKEETMGIETVVDELLNGKPGEVKPEESGRDESHHEENITGWLTSLPKELRDGVDPARYSSLAEYIKDLRANQKDAPVSEEEAEKSWKELRDGVSEGSSDADSDMMNSLLDSMRASGITAEIAKSVFDSYGESARKLVEKKQKDAQDALANYIGTKWGEKKDSYFSLAQKGLKVIADADVDILRNAKESGLTKDPAFLEVCRMLGERTSEHHMTETTRNQTGPKFNPMNPLGYEH